VPADGAELALHIARPILIARLLDVAGQPWPPEEPEQRSGRSPWLDMRPMLEGPDWPARPAVTLFTCDTDALGALVAGKLLPGKPQETGELVYEVAEGTRYLLGARGPGFDGALREVELRRGSGPLVVELCARELGPLGTISVRVRHAERQLAGGFDGECFELAAGAKVELSLAGSADAADLAAARAANPWVEEQADLGSFEREAEYARRAASAEVQLVAPGRRREPVLRVGCAFEGTSAAGEHLLEDWPLGATYLSEMLPAGRCTLVARLSGGREARAELVLVAGQTTQATLRF
jgi:hypothetical protein